MKTVLLLLKLPQALHHSLKMAATEKGTNMRAWVNEAIQEKLKRESSAKMAGEQANILKPKEVQK